jgi:hypothetical protein
LNCEFSTKMAFSAATQATVILSIFVIPILTYIYFTRSQQPKSTGGPLPPPTEITALFIHPIKSCHGISVQSAKLLHTGLDLGTPLLSDNPSRPWNINMTRPPMDVG